MNKKVIKFLWEYLKEYKIKYLFGAVFVIGASLISILTGYLNGLSVEKITTFEFKLSILALIIYFIFNLIQSLLRKVSNVIFQKVSNDVMEKITYNVFEKIGLLPAKAFEEKSSGELINRVTGDSTNIVSNLNQLIWIGSDIVAIIVIAIYILINSWVIFLEIAIYLIIFYFFTKKYMPKLKENQKEIKNEIDKTTSKVNEAIRGVREIRALGIREKINKRVKKDIVEVFKKRNETVDFTENYYAIVRYMNATLEALVFISCIFLLMYGQVNLTFVIAMTWYIYRFMHLFESITSISTSFQTLVVSAERILELLNNTLYKDMKFGMVNKKVEGNIIFKNINFSYSVDEPEILKNFNLEIEKNKVTALVGKSGGGKTTIFNLLLRYFDVNDGEILIDSVNIKDFTEKSLQQNTAIIRQDPFLFNLTILENFRILDEKVSLKKVREYCKKAEIDEYIMSLPNSYDTLIGEGGINLSGGQKQRLAIARALMKESKILLLDEATSALDNVNQEKIKKVIMNLAKDHTIIIVAHRLSTIIDADLICFMEQGQVKIRGTHKELLRKSKEYKKLYLNDEINEM
ncbi:MAG: ABC transporter ATP-binding protein [Firmicutes bacterium]|nr:ABC transporter ATP-binding protein [Bacillota bacterium]